VFVLGKPVPAGQPKAKPMRVLSFDDLKARGIVFSKTHLHRLMNAGKFPRAAKIGIKRLAWDEAEIDDWIKAQFLKRDRTAA
jgi:prophage regulatory protein